jgi:hypothetical protein
VGRELDGFAGASRQAGRFEADDRALDPVGRQEGAVDLQPVGDQAPSKWPASSMLSFESGRWTACLPQITSRMVSLKLAAVAPLTPK